MTPPWKCEVRSLRCPSCGADVTDGSRFCPYCGQHLATSDEPTVEVATADDPTAVHRPLSEAREGPPLLSCSRCGAPNSRHRVLCGRCGADLETGDVGVDPRPAPSPSTPGGRDRERDRAASRRVWIVVVVLGALTGSAIGLAVWLRSDGVGPGTEPEPTFDPARYADDPEQLGIDRVSASSQLSPEGSIGYEPALAIDGDRTTAWNEGAEGDGVGEHLRLELTQAAWVRRLVISNGYQKDDRTFFDNARAARLLVRFDDAAYAVELHDRTGDQEVTLPEPVLTRTVTFEVLDVVAGRQYDDLAISEVRILGWPSRDDAASG